MLLKNLIKTNVNKAFNLLGDLKSTAIIFIDGDYSFDFNESDVITESQNRVIVSCILINKQKRANDKDISVVRLIFAKNDIIALLPLNKVVVDNVAYKIIAPISDDGFIIELEGVKE